MENRELSKEFLDALEKYGDCPQTIFEMANTPFEKAVAIEFFNNQEDRNLMKAKMDHIDWLLKLLVSGTGVLGAAFIISKVIEYLVL